MKGKGNCSRAVEGFKTREGETGMKADGNRKTEGENSEIGGITV